MFIRTAFPGLATQISYTHTKGLGRLLHTSVTDGVTVMWPLSLQSDPLTNYIFN